MQLRHRGDTWIGRFARSTVQSKFTSRALIRGQSNILLTACHEYNLNNTIEKIKTVNFAICAICANSRTNEVSNWGSFSPWGCGPGSNFWWSLFCAGLRYRVGLVRSVRTLDLRNKSRLYHNQLNVQLALPHQIPVRVSRSYTLVTRKAPKSCDFRQRRNGRAG